MKKWRCVAKRIFSALLAATLFLGCLHVEVSAENIAEEETIKVACVGDSLTEGYKSSGGLKSSTAYPAVLQNMLGTDYEVENYGKSSYTLMKNTDRSYWDSEEYGDSLAYDADIVLIMLGTNDSKAAYWNEEKFQADAKALVESYEDEGVRVIFAASPQCYQTTGTDITRSAVETMYQTQKKLIAEENWETVNMYLLTADREDLYNQDKVHFTDEGYSYLAECMYQAITGEEFVSAGSVTIPHTKTTGENNYFTFSDGNWTTGNTAHTWSNPIDTDNPSDTWYEVRFTGNRIDVYSGKNFMMGNVEYFVDDKSYGIFDQYNASNINSTLITTISGLEEGTHTFRAVAVGTRNSSGSGDIRIDAAEVVVYSADIAAQDAELGANISRLFDNTTDPGNNSWVFVGGEAVQGTYAQLGGGRNYIGHFEEYARNQKSAGNDPTRQRYVINRGKSGQTIADIVENWEEQVTRFDPRAIAYMVGVEDYEKGADHIDAFKDSLAQLIDLGLAEKENHGSYVVIQKPFAVQDDAVNEVIELYCAAVDQVVEKYKDDVQKYENIMVIDHYTQTEGSSDFKTGKLNEDGSLNELGHVEIGRQFVVSTMGTDAQYPCSQGIRMGQTAEEAPEIFLDLEPEVVAGNAVLNVTIPDTEETAWKYMVETEGMQLTGTASGNDFTISGLADGASYTLKIQTEDGKKQLTTMMGTVTAGENAIKDQQTLDTNQQKIAKLMAEKESLTWLFVGDSITHALVYTYGYGGTAQMFEKFLKDDLNRTDDVVVNTAVSGATTASTLNNIEQRVRKYVPDVVFIMLGTNDGYPGENISSDQYEANLRTIIGHIRDVNEDAVIILRSPTAMISDDGRKANVLVNIERMKKVADEDPNLIYVDQYTEMNRALTTYSWLGNNNQLFLGNWLHPGINGQIVMAQNLIRACGLWTEDSAVTNLYYKTPITEENSTVLPTVTAASHTLGITRTQLTADSNLAVGSITISARSGEQTYETTAQADDTAAVLRGLPNGTYEVAVSAYLTDTAKKVTFTKQNITITDQMQSEYQIRLSNLEARGLTVGDTVGVLSMDEFAPTGTYTYTLCEGEGSTNNEKFVIEVSELKVASRLTVGKDYYIRIKASNGQIEQEQTFVIRALKKTEEPSDATRDIPVTSLTATAGSTHSSSDPQKALDGNTDTFWETNWGNGVDNTGKLWYQLELKEVTKIDRLRYYPRYQGVNVNMGYQNGFVSRYTVQVSLDGNKWVDVASNVNDASGWTPAGKWYAVDFDAVEAKYVRFVGEETITNGNAVTKDMTIGELRICAAKEEIPEMPFEDVIYGQYYYDAVLWAVDHEITTGRTETLFCPNDACTRAQVVMFLWRAAGSPEPKTEKNPFSDVSSGSRYYKAIMWAVEQGITKGYPDETFQPDREVTRAEFVTFQYRSNGEPELEDNTNPFVDVTSAHKNFKSAILWAYQNNITKGKDANHFRSDITCSRGDVVTFLYRGAAK